MFLFWFDTRGLTPPIRSGLNVQQFELSEAALPRVGENGSPDSKDQIPDSCHPPRISFVMPGLFRYARPSPTGISQTWLVTKTSRRLESSGALSRFVRNGSMALWPPKS